MDPVSLTASTASIVTIGVQILKGAIDFVSNVKNASGDVKNLRTQSKCLKSILEAIGEAWENSGKDPKLADRIKEVQESSNCALIQLKEKIEKLKVGQPAPSHIGGALRAASVIKFVLHDKKDLEILMRYTREIRNDLNALMDLCLFNDIRTEVRKVQHDLLGTRTEMHQRFKKTHEQNFETYRLVGDTYKLLSGTNERVTALAKNNNHDKILNWLESYVRFDRSHDDVHRRRMAGTGQWIFDTTEWKAWHASKNSFLWLNGTSGTGKSVLCSSIIENLREEARDSEEIIYAYHYFSFANVDQQKLSTCIASVIFQMLRVSGIYIQELESAWQTSQPNLPPVEVLTTILKTYMKRWQRIFLVFDALDECPESGDRKNILDWLEGLHKEGLDELAIVATSRNHGDIQHTLSEKIRAHDLKIDKLKIRNDIACYVEHEIRHDRKLGKMVHRDEVFVKNIIEMIVEKSDGMFLWAECQLTSLKSIKLVNKDRITKAIRDLPRDLHSHYENLLNAIDESYAPLVRRALIWISNAHHPLTLEELAEACLVDPDSAAASNVVDPKDKFDPENIFDLIPDLVVREQEYKDSIKIRLAHFSIQEYLGSKDSSEGNAKQYHLNTTDAQSFIVRGCLRYIMYATATQGRPSLRSNREHIPLIYYASRFWYHHYQAVNHVYTDPAGIDFAGIERLIYKLFSTPEEFHAWLTVYPPDSEHHGRSAGPKYGSPLYFAAFLGLFDCFRRLVENGCDVNAVGGAFYTPLQAAAAGKQREILYWLLGMNADPHIQGGKYGNVLGACAVNGLYDCVEKLLLYEGVDVRANNSVALHQACAAGDVKLVREFIAAGASVHALHPQWDTPLVCAAREDHCEVIRILYKEGADINQLLPEDRGYSDDPARRTNVTALQSAATDGSPRALKLLIEYGADLNAIGGRYDSAIRIAVYSRSLEALQILLNHGADPNLTPRGEDSNPLHTALGWGSYDIAAMLVDAGAIRFGYSREQMEREVAETGGSNAWAQQHVFRFPPD